MTHHCDRIIHAYKSLFDFDDGRWLHEFQFFGKQLSRPTHHHHHHHHIQKRNIEQQALLNHVIPILDIIYNIIYFQVPAIQFLRPLPLNVFILYCPIYILACFFHTSPIPFGNSPQMGQVRQVHSHPFQVDFLGGTSFPISSQC